MKTIKTLLSFFVCLFLFFIGEAQTITYKATKDSNLLIIQTEVDTNVISLKEIEYQLTALDQRLDELTQEQNKVQLRRNEYAALKQKYLSLPKK